MYICNRFPICAVAGYAIAKRHYNQKLSESLGMALATKMAIWRNVGRGKGLATNKHYGAGRVSEKQLGNEDKLNAGLVDELDFCGENFLRKGDQIVGELHIEKPFNDCNSEKFNFQVHKIDTGGGDFGVLLNAINAKLESEEWRPYDLAKSVYGKKWMQFWKSIRDNLREKTFYEI